MSSHIAQVRAQFAADRKAVLWLTGMTDEELSRFQFESGVDWLSWYTKDDAATLTELMQLPEIWKWWTNEWQRRDARDILALLFRTPKQERLAQYRARHQNVYIEHTPPYTFLHQAYAVAIAKAQKQAQTTNTHDSNLRAD